MFKYILKRLGLALIVLLGVSVIIYFLVRLMPTDYLETKFSAQLLQGTITQEQLDDFKKSYGLYMPDAYVDIAVEDGDYAGETFHKDAKVRNYSDAANGFITYVQFFAGTYECGKENIYLELKDDGTYRILDKSEDVAKTLESGRYTATEGGIVMEKGIDSYTGAATYTVASFWDKAGAIFSGYFAWLGNMLRGDMGDSFLYQQPVSTVIGQHMWISFAISLVALILQFAIAIPLGITSATHQ